MTIYVHPKYSDTYRILSNYSFCSLQNTISVLFVYFFTKAYAGFLAGSFENKGFLYRLFLVKYRFFWQILQQNKEQKEVNFLAAFPDFMLLKPAITTYTAMCSKFMFCFSLQLYNMSQIAVLSMADINNLHGSKLKSSSVRNVTQYN